MGFVSVSGVVGEGNRRAVYNTLHRLACDTIAVRSKDTELLNIVRKAVREKNKSVLTLPLNQAFGVGETVWVFGSLDNPDVLALLDHFKKCGVTPAHIVV